MKPHIKKTSKLGLISFFAIIIIVVLAGIFILRQHYLVPILTYHNVTDTVPDKDNLLAVSASTFQRQMKFLRQRNYNLISLKELAGLIKEKSDIPRNSVVITFDDGYKDNFTIAFPVLEKYEIPATIFVCPLLISQEAQYLTWPQVKKLSDSDLIDIGSHTLNHAFLPDIKEENRLAFQIKGSKGILEDILKVPIEFFSYPAGGFNRKIRQIVKESGYLAAVATKPGREYPDDDIFALKRMRISEHNKNLFIFWFKLTGFYTPIREWQRRYKDKGLAYRYD